MNGKLIPWVALVFAWSLLSAESCARPSSHWYMAVAVPEDMTVDGLEMQAHLFFSHGAPVAQPRSIHDDIALDFYNALTASVIHPYFLLLYPTLEGAEMSERRSGPMNAIIFEVAPDERVFHFGQTMHNLKGVVPMQGDLGRSLILRFLANAARDVGDDAAIAGMPLAVDDAPIDPVIQGAHIERARIYLNNVLVRTVDRIDQQDGPFIEPGNSHVTEGYPFNPPRQVFPVHGRIVSVAPGTDNLTLFGPCNTQGPAPIRSGRFDRKRSLENACPSEMTSLDEFNRRHVRHEGIMVPVTLLLW
ncbi:hypothetical protein [Dyella choica]|uniref:Uncharacterized protein n=1 Tax=Dyella choica TaxID=1927959 RepID=A0A3S0WW85_9GAMM|nr:hypothetical protein [Dyella choica]RUL76091.1 hypothetical protein EKH80_10285 [Dyella choica]